MKRRLMICGVLSSLMLAACVSTVPLTVKVNQRNSGGHLVMYRGQELVVELQRSNDAAYAWTVSSYGPAVFENPTKQVIQLEGQSVVVERYIFTAMRLGEDQIRIAELRSDQVASSARREFEMRITVEK